MTRLGDVTTGGMEWQTSTYSFNKHAIKTLPAAAASVEKLIENYVTLKAVGDRKNMDTRAIRTLLAARRKSVERVYVSSPRIKDFGTHIHMTAFVFDGSTDKVIQEEKMRRLQKAAVSPRNDLGETDTDRLLERRHYLGLQSLISRIYGRPVELRLIRLASPHLDAEILAAFIAQRLRDRTNTPRRVIRDATWKAPLPDARAVSKIQQYKQLRRINGLSNRLSWQDLTMKSLGPTSTSSIVKKLALSQVSSVQVEAAGRLTKRLTANRSARKMARHGTTSKLPSPILLGHRKKHTQYAFRGGKRRVGQYGIRVHLGHT